MTFACLLDALFYACFMADVIDDLTATLLFSPASGSVKENNAPVYGYLSPPVCPLQMSKTWYAILEFMKAPVRGDSTWKWFSPTILVHLKSLELHVKYCPCYSWPILPCSHHCHPVPPESVLFWPSTTVLMLGCPGFWWATVCKYHSQHHRCITTWTALTWERCVYHNREIYQAKGSISESTLPSKPQMILGGFTLQNQLRIVLEITSESPKNPSHWLSLMTPT